MKGHIVKFEPQNYDNQFFDKPQFSLEDLCLLWKGCVADIRTMENDTTGLTDPTFIQGMTWGLCVQVAWASLIKGVSRDGLIEIGRRISMSDPYIFADQVLLCVNEINNGRYGANDVHP